MSQKPCKLQNNRSFKVLTSASLPKQGVLTTPLNRLLTTIPSVATAGKVWVVVDHVKQGPQGKGHDIAPLNEDADPWGMNELLI